MDVFNVKELNFSIVNFDEYNRDNAKDTLTPFSFVDFINFLQTEYAPEKYSSFYSAYLKDWYALQGGNLEEQKQQYIVFYREFIQEIILNYTTLTEKNFLKKIDYSSPTDLDIAIPFYANKLTEVALFYRNKREDGKYVITRNKVRGSVSGVERAIFDNIYDFVTSSEDVLLNTKTPLSGVIKDFGVGIHEYVDVYGDYFDLDRKGDDEGGVRKMLYDNNLVDIDPDYYFDPEALKVLTENSFLSLIGDFTINAPEFSQNDITNICNPEDSILEELNEVYTTGGLTLAEVYELKKQLIAKYVSCDFYYLDSTTYPATSGVMFEADQPTNNLLNLQTADIAAVPSNQQKILRDVGLFFKPDDIGIFKLNAVSSRFEIDVDNVEPNKVYIFPDPNIYGNVGVNALSSYPYIHTFDYRDNIRNISSGVATGDPEITNKSLTFEPYSTKQRESQELKTLNTLGYHLNFSDLDNRGAIRKMGFDCFGNEYALFKAEELEDRTTVSRDILLSLRLDGHTFFDSVFNEGYNFDYSAEGCGSLTIRSGIETFTDTFTNGDNPYYLFFRLFQPYDELRGQRVCDATEYSASGGGFTSDDTTPGDDESIAGLFRDGGGFTQGDGSPLPDPIKTDEPGFPSPLNYYYQIFVDCKLFDDDVRSIPGSLDYNCGKFSDTVLVDRQFNYDGDGYAYIDYVHSNSTTELSNLSGSSSGDVNVERAIVPGSIFIKDQGTSLSYPMSSILSNTLNKYSDDVVDDVLNNTIDFDVISDSIFLQTPTRLVIDKINYSSSSTFDKPNTRNTVFSVSSGDTLNVLSNRLLVNEIESCAGGSVVFFSIFKTLSTSPYTGKVQPKNYWYVYPEIYQYNIINNRVDKIFPQELNQSDLESFQTSYSGAESDFAPEKIKTPVMTYNSLHNKLKVTYMLYDQNNFSHIHDCMFEWKSGKLTLNRVVRYTPDDLVLRTTTFNPDTTFTTINNPTGSYTISQNTLSI
jgi:hypothetical protein